MSFLKLNCFVLFFCCFLISCGQEEKQSCINLYELKISYSKNNVPRKFNFVYRKVPEYSQGSLRTIYPIKDAIDYAGKVQFMQDSGYQEFRISYIDPGEENLQEDMQVIAVDSISGKTDSTAVENLWGTGSLFSRSNIFHNKWKAMRFLTPVFVERDGKIVDAGYACSEWENLREVAKSYCRKSEGLVKQGRVDKTGLEPPLSADNWMERLKDDIDRILECSEEEF